MKYGFDERRPERSAWFGFEANCETVIGCRDRSSAACSSPRDEGGEGRTCVA